VRELNYNTGLRGVLFEARHFQRMGSAIWLYGWLVLRQTHQSEGKGWVLGGAPVRYKEIEEETGFNRRTLERWMHVLRGQRYIETEAVPGGVVIRITKAKKFAHVSGTSAERVRKAAEGGTQSGVAIRGEIHLNHEVGGRISSSSVERIKERAAGSDSHKLFHRDFHSPPQNANNSHPRKEPQVQTANPSFLGKDENQTPQQQPQPIRHTQQQYNFQQESRVRVQLLRASRADAVRRELAVGTGPEVPRS
jgi:hypothetical protein